MTKRTNFGSTRFGNNSRGNSRMKKLTELVTKCTKELKSEFDGAELTVALSAIKSKHQDAKSPLESEVIAIVVYSTKEMKAVSVPLTVIDPSVEYDAAEHKIDDSTVESTLTHSDQNDPLLRQYVAKKVSEDMGGNYKVMGKPGTVIPPSVWNDDDDENNDVLYDVVHHALAAGGTYMSITVTRTDRDYTIADLGSGVNIQIKSMDGVVKSNGLIPCKIRPQVSVAASIVDNRKGHPANMPKSYIHSTTGSGELMFRGQVRMAMRYTKQSARRGEAMGVKTYLNAWIPCLIIEQLDMEAIPTMGRMLTMFSMLSSFSSFDAVSALVNDDARYLNVRSNLLGVKKPAEIPLEKWRENKSDILRDLIMQKIAIGFVVRSSSVTSPSDHEMVTTTNKEMIRAVEKFTGKRLPEKIRESKLIDSHKDIEYYGDFLCPSTKKRLPLSDITPEYLLKYGYANNSSDIMRKWLQSYSPSINASSRGALREEVISVASEGKYNIEDKGTMVTVAPTLIRYLRSCIEDAEVKVTSRNNTINTNFSSNEWEGWHGSDMTDEGSFWS